jgi:sugar/nucleoside kinase (ribokinase family)
MQLNTFKPEVVEERVIAALPELIARLDGKIHPVFSAFLGFDACIDIIVRVVREKAENDTVSFFNESSGFGQFLMNLDNHSCGVELQTRFSKPGGNMVITANALGNLGVKTDCFGTFGLPEILPAFHSMSANCSLFTIGETISATALEFDRSKVIMFDPGPYNHLTWESIRERAGIGRLQNSLSGKQLIAFVNWSEIENSSLIWKGFLDEVIPFVPQLKERPLFFTDFSDCSRRTRAEIKAAIELLGLFRKYFRVIISLNKNEADLISASFDIKKDTSDEVFIKDLYKSVNADIVTIHRVNDALAYDGVSFESCSTFLCADPVILTGGGDNYNAGFCFSMLKGLGLFQSLIIANAVSGAYVKTGISPTLESLIDFLQR